MSLVNLHQVHKYYGEHHVLKGINLNIQAGDVVSIIGKSGSGKSTLLRCINGLEEYQQGGIILDGKEVTTEDIQVRRLALSVGMIFQNFNLFPHLTVGENIALAPKIVLKKSKADAANIAKAMLDKVGLAEKFDRYPEELSGGQQQRVAIARALAMSPKVLLCDEITSALDPELVGEVLRVLEQLAEEGITLILVTHEMNFARDVGNRVVFMHEGKVWEEGDAKHLLSEPHTDELKQFIGAVL